MRRSRKNTTQAGDFLSPAQLRERYNAEDTQELFMVLGVGVCVGALLVCLVLGIDIKYAIFMLLAMCVLGTTYSGYVAEAHKQEQRRVNIASAEERERVHEAELGQVQDWIKGLNYPGQEEEPKTSSQLDLFV